MRKGLIIGVLLAATMTTTLAGGSIAADRVDQNLQIIVEAAKDLSFPDHADNRAYLLIKQETIRSPVGVIFGYADNEAACEQIASVLSAVLDVGTFKCGPIY
ncbi:hypothetical protein HBA54_04150 [Pelagibius litoralis]|uniref:UrcA family protein n=1 Tax=Pelagibius litoralis TaxID=374515 RepID=A0A967EVF4_9PROT|nr:hypothetical protein [Pelagibius litoralis]NIA67774.1 hypothetical protein [Pelagibius litoralis]